MSLISDRRPPLLSGAGGGGSAAPTGPAGGDLSGTYPDPSVVNDSHNHTALTVSDLTAMSMNSAYVDGIAMVASLRTLGTGAQQACAGNDSRLFPLSAALPQALAATPLAGSSGQASDAGHVHPLPSASETGGIPAPASPVEGALLVYQTGAWRLQNPGADGTVLRMGAVTPGYPGWGALMLLLYTSGLVDALSVLGQDAFFLPGAGTGWF